ncbi:MAG: prepilin peptidase [Lachnospiraceae bacterium]
MWKIENIMMLIFLFICTVYDIRMRGIPNLIMYSGSGLVIVLRCMKMEMPCFLWIGGGILGVFFLLISKYTKEALGYGDSWMILLLGVYLGLWNLLLLLSVALFLCSFGAMYQFLRHKSAEKATLPFLPFLTIAFISVVII